MLDRCSRLIIGSEFTLYMAYFIYGNRNSGGWNPLWKIIRENLSGL